MFSITAVSYTHLDVYKRQGKRYSVTYFVNDSKQEGISFCEFYKEPVEFYKAEDFMNNAKIENELLSLIHIFPSL